MVTLAAVALALRAVSAIVVFAIVAGQHIVSGFDPRVADPAPWLMIDNTHALARTFDNSPGQMELLAVWTAVFVAVHLALVALVIRAVRPGRLAAIVLSAVAAFVDLAYLPSVLRDWVRGQHVYDY